MEENKMNKVEPMVVPKVDKELELTRKKKHVENLKREIENAADQKKDIIERRDVFIEKIDASRLSASLVLKNFKIIRPNWAYEEDPEYLEALKKVNDCIFRENELNWKTQLVNIANNIEATEKQKEALTTELARIEKEMNKNG